MAKPLGMMSGCYFVGRGQLIEWVNDLLALNYTKVEDTANGAAYCQIIDAIHPGTVNLGRVKYDSYAPADIINNYKVLQDAFNKNGIQQYIDVMTLSKGKYMAALEMFQWIHGYYQQTGPHDAYDAVARRKQFKCKEPTGTIKPGAVNDVKPAGMARRLKPVAGVTPTCVLNAANVPESYGSLTGDLAPGSIPGANSNIFRTDFRNKPDAKNKAAQNKVDVRASAPAKQKNVKKNDDSASVASSATTVRMQELQQANKHIEELEDEIQQSNQERDFYYNKLRSIEVFCQEHGEDELIKKVLEIMYETDEQNGFVSPGEEDEVQ